MNQENPSTFKRTIHYICDVHVIRFQTQRYEVLNRTLHHISAFTMYIPVGLRGATGINRID